MYRDHLRTFPLSTEKWGRPPISYHGNTSISQIIVHTPSPSTNTSAPGNKTKTWTTLDLTYGAGKYVQ